MGDASKIEPNNNTVLEIARPSSGCDSMLMEKEIKTTIPGESSKLVPHFDVNSDFNNKDNLVTAKEIPPVKDEPEYTNSYIFSINGAPSRRIRRPLVNDNNELVHQKMEKNDQRPTSNYRNPLTGTGVSSTDEISYRPKGRLSVKQATEMVQNQPQSNLELKRPSSSFRNPLTGTGLSSIDEINLTKSNTSNKDGNPLLGVGYDSKRVITDPVPSDKIHPAGYVRKGVAQSPNNHRIPPGGYSSKLW